MAVGCGRGAGDWGDDVLVVAVGCEEVDGVGRDRVEMKVVAVGKVDVEGGDGSDTARLNGRSARSAVYCGGDGGGERRHSTDSDGSGLEGGCGIVRRKGCVVRC